MRDEMMVKFIGERLDMQNDFKEFCQDLHIKAKEILMLGDFISGEKAVEFGLANISVTREKLLETTMELAKKLANKAPLALAAIKRTINIGSELDYDAGLEYELAEFMKFFTTEDQKEGMKAFFEKRKPNFKGK